MTATITYTDRRPLPLSASVVLGKERNRRARRARPEFLAWLFDDADARDADPVFAEMPPPGRMVYSQFLNLRRDAQRQWQI